MASRNRTLGRALALGLVLAAVFGFVTAGPWRAETRARDTPAAQARRGGTVVQVLNVHGRGLGGVRVDVVAAGEADDVDATILDVVPTDRDGLAVIEDQPLDGSVVARVVGSTLDGDAARRDGNRSGVLADLARMGTLPVTFVALDAAKKRLRLRYGLPLAMRLFGAEDGARRVSLLDGAPLFRDFRPNADGPFDVGAEATLTAALAPGEPYRVALALSAAGEAIDPIAWEGQLLPTTESVEVWIPVRSEARIHLLAAGGGEIPRESRGDVLWFIEGPGEEHNTSTPVFARTRVEASGLVAVHGVPHVVGAWVHVLGRLGARWFEAAGRLPEDPRTPLTLQPGFAAPDSPRADTLAAFHRQEASRIESESHEDGWIVSAGPEHEGREGLFHPVQPRDGTLVDDPTGGAPFDVIVDAGREFAGVLAGGTVWLGNVERRTDAQGIARFRGLAPGLHRGWVFGFGAVRQIAINVPASGTGRYVVKPAWGGTIDLTVVDDMGRPLPYASFVVRQPSAAPWACPLWRGSVRGLPVAQRLDRHVDQGGKRRLPCIEAGRVTLEVRYGWRQNVVTLDVEDGVVLELVVELPMHPGASASRPPR